MKKSISLLDIWYLCQNIRGGYLKCSSTQGLKEFKGVIFQKEVNFVSFKILFERSPSREGSQVSYGGG